MYDRLMNFLIKHQILCKYQFGFRSGYSADMALTVLLDFVAGCPPVRPVPTPSSILHTHSGIRPFGPIAIRSLPSPKKFHPRILRPPAEKLKPFAAIADWESGVGREKSQA